MSNVRLLICTASLLAAGALACGGSIAISPVSLPNAVQHQPFSTQLVGTGSQPVSWTVTKGLLPTGITLNAKNGLLAGTPTVAGTFTFSIKGSDSSTFSSSTGTESYTLTVIPELVITSSLGPATAGSAYSAPLTATGGVAPYTFTVVGLHAGLSFSSSTATISGTPPLENMYNVTVSVTDSGMPQQTASSVQALLIRPPNVVITTTTLPTGHVGEAYQAALVATQGSGDFTWAISNGVLPAGLSLSTTTGVISGTPTAAGMTPISITVTDDGDADASATANFTLDVVGYSPVQINTSALPEAMVGVEYDYTIQTVGGSDNFSFTVDTGMLPPNITLNSGTGELKGTPSTGGTYSFDIKVADLGSPPDSAHQSYTLVVESVDGGVTKVEITTTALPTGHVGAPYEAPIATADGSSSNNFTWSISSGTLPAGLSLNASDGVISGTPTTAGTTPIDVTVTDNGDSGATATASFSLVVVSYAAVQISTTALPAGTVSTAYSFTIATTGGSGHFAFSIDSGSLPDNITLDGTTGTLSGTPSMAGTSTFDVTVTDLDSPPDSAQQSLTLTINS